MLLVRFIFCDKEIDLIEKKCTLASQQGFVQCSFEACC